MTRWGMDVGSSTTVVCDSAGGFVLEEPSVLMDRHRGRGAVVGCQAGELSERIDLQAHTVRPVSGGVVTDLDGARRYLRALVRRVLPRPWQRFRLSVAVAVPAGASALERRALVEAAEEAGITRVVAVAAPVAAALGCGADPLDRRVHMVADVGAGTAEIMAVCAGEVLTTRSTGVAGAAVTAAIRRHLREQHGVLLGDAAAEDVAILASAASADGEVSVSGRGVADARPRSLRLAAAELHPVLSPVVHAITVELVGCLDDLPARGLDDVAADGVLLVGGASPVRGLRAGLEAGLGLPVKQTENATTCVAQGAVRVFGDAALADAYASYDR